MVTPYELATGDTGALVSLVTLATLATLVVVSHSQSLGLRLADWLLQQRINIAPHFGAGCLWTQWSLLRLLEVQTLVTVFKGTKAISSTGKCCATM